MELLNQSVNKYNDKEIKSIEIQQRKSLTGFRDVDGFIKKCIYENKKPNIKVVIGRTAIIDDDIKYQMNEAGSLYDLSFIATTITSAPQLLQTLKALNNADTDIIVVSRGGGDDLEMYNKTDLAEYCLSLTPFFMTAIAHKQNVTLLEKIADRKFITPTAFGQYLKEIYNTTIEDLQSSKAKLVEDVSRQFKINHEKEISNLTQQLNAKNKILHQTKHLLDSKQKRNSTTIIIAVILAVVIGIVIGLLFKR